MQLASVVTHSPPPSYVLWGTAVDTVSTNVLEHRASILTCRRSSSSSKLPAPTEASSKHSHWPTGPTVSNCGRSRGQGHIQHPHSGDLSSGYDMNTDSHRLWSGHPAPTISRSLAGHHHACSTRGLTRGHLGCGSAPLVPRAHILSSMPSRCVQ